MVSGPNSVQSLKALVRQAPGHGEIKTVILDLHRENNERSTVLTLASLLDHALQIALLTKMRRDLIPPEQAEMFGGRGLLATFSAKIDLAYALKLIGPKTRDDIDMIREIRNAFAHARGPISFQTKEVATVCARLRFPAAVAHAPNEPQLNRFKMCATLLTLTLYDYEHDRKHPWLKDLRS
jgi:hypothetical protein